MREQVRYFKKGLILGEFRLEALPAGGDGLGKRQDVFLLSDRL